MSFFNGSNNGWFAKKIMNQHNSASAFTNTIRSISTGNTSYRDENSGKDDDGNTYFICGSSENEDHVCGP